MCGIVGVVGNLPATEVLIQGLEKLEYRGYDSAGIYVVNEHRPYLTKAVGRIAALKEKLTPEMNGHLGIGHTRWATHGKPTIDNAHPHQSEDGRYTLVHNGVITNFNELKDRYLSNVQFKSDTDTEVIVQLLAFFAKQGMTTKEALKKVMSELQGSYALAIIDVEDPQTLYIAKNKSPLLIGKGDGFNVICSDAMAMVQYTKEFLEIMDEELVILTADNIRIENLLGEALERQSYKASVDAKDIEKGTYPYYMLKEIHEQPAVMRRIVQHYQEQPISEELLKALDESDRLYIIACGTSYHAGRVGAKMMQTWANKPVEVHIASEFGYHFPVLSERPFFIFISQSGETADSRQVLVEVKKQGYPTLTLTNVAGSTLARESDNVLLLEAGPEIAVASTKAYTAQLAVLAILSQQFGCYLNNKAAQQVDIFHELGLVAQQMESVMDEQDHLEVLSDKVLSQTRNAFYLGRYIDEDVAREAALKLKEISYIQAESFAAGELKHGPIALIEEGTPVIGLISDEVTAHHMRGNLKEVESRGALTVTIAMENVATAHDDIVIKKTHPLLAPLVMVIPCQLLAYFATLQRGLDVDKPRNLAKSVTVE